MSEKICCALAKRLGDRLAALDAELRKEAHLGYAKLAAQYGQPASSIERHKKVCLGLARTSKPSAPVPDPAAAPPIVVSSKPSLDERLDGTQKILDTQDSIAGTSAREPPNLAESRAHKVAWILRQMILGQWTDENERAQVRLLVDRWKLSPDTVAEYVRSAKDSLAISSASVAQVKAYSAHWHETIRDKALDDETLDLRTAATAQSNYDRALGVTGDAKIQINLAEDPKFRAAAQRFVDAVQDVLTSPEAIAERLVEAGTPVPSDLIGTVLAAADAAIAERLAPKPMLLRGA